MSIKLFRAEEIDPVVQPEAAGWTPVTPPTFMTNLLAEWPPQDDVVSRAFGRSHYFACL
jgi:hypothetical protein